MRLRGRLLNSPNPDQKPLYLIGAFLAYVIIGAAVAAAYGTRGQKYKRVFVIYLWPAFALFIMVPVGIYYFFCFTLGLIAALFSGTLRGFLQAILDHQNERLENHD